MAQTKKNTRGPAKLAWTTYEQIAEWTDYRLHTVRSYATRGVFDAHNLEACLIWVNERRQSLGWELIGIPAETPETSGVDSSVNETAAVTPVVITDYGCDSPVGKAEAPGA